MGAVQRPTVAHQSEPGAVLAARHDLRRRWAVNFALPDLRARTPIHVGSGHTLGERGGEPAHTLSIPNCPTHTHVAKEHQQRYLGSPSRTTFRGICPRRHADLWRPANLVAMNTGMVASIGGQPAHLNMQPFLTLTSASRCRASSRRPISEECSTGWPQPYVGEIRMFAGNFAPAGWMFCEGQLLPISENETLVSADWHDLRGGRGVDVRAARPARPDSHSPGQRIHPGGNWWGGRDHADSESDSRARSSDAGRQPLGNGQLRPGPSSAPPRRDVIRVVVRRAGHESTGHLRRREAASRTLTSSRICASTSSFRCSGFSRPPLETSDRQVGRRRHSTRWRERWPIRLLLKSESFRSTSRPRGGRGATGSCCRCRRTPRSSRCLGPPTAANGK